MNYLLLNFVFTLLALAIAWPLRRKLNWRIVAVVFVALSLMTLIFDNMIVANGIVAYEESKILGLRLWFAPIEDWGYVVVGCWLIPAIFKFFSRNSDG